MVNYLIEYTRPITSMYPHTTNQRFSMFGVSISTWISQIIIIENRRSKNHSNSKLRGQSWTQTYICGLNFGARLRWILHLRMCLMSWSWTTGPDIYSYIYLICGIFHSDRMIKMQEQRWQFGRNRQPTLLLSVVGKRCQHKFDHRCRTIS